MRKTTHYLQDLQVTHSQHVTEKIFVGNPRQLNNFTQIIKKFQHENFQIYGISAMVIISTQAFL